MALLFCYCVFKLFFYQVAADVSPLCVFLVSYCSLVSPLGGVETVSIRHEKLHYDELRLRRYEGRQA